MRCEHTLDIFPCDAKDSSNCQGQEIRAGNMAIPLAFQPVSWYFPLCPRNSTRACGSTHPEVFRCGVIDRLEPLLHTFLCNVILDLKVSVVET